MKKQYEYCNDNMTIMPGFYESELYSSDTIYEANEQMRAECQYNGEEFVEHDIVDFDGFRNKACERIVCELITPMLTADKTICDNVSFKVLKSPRFYNYTTDKLVLELNIDIDRLKNIIRSDKGMYDGFNKYLNKKYSSCSGFMSFVENEIEAYFKRDEYHDVMIDYYFLTLIYNANDVIEANEVMNDYTEYEYGMMEIAHDTLYDFLKPITPEN